jgi:flagellar biosynthetic protein FliP
MRNAICPQPNKRMIFIDEQELIKEKINKVTSLLSLSLLIFLICAFSSQALADGGFTGFPALNVTSNGSSTEYSFPLQILLLMTALTVLPSLVLGMTSFTRIIIVMSILRQALGTQQTPPNQVLIAISLFLTFFIMAPTFNKVYDNAAVPYMDKTMPANIAIDKASSEMKKFMVKNTRKSDLIMFSELAGLKKYDQVSDIPFRIALPAFMTSELKTAFQIGFLLFLPFLVIDMVISSILMSLGMMMLSPMLVALPFKLLLFVLVDGWSMTVGSLVSTFAAG